MLTQEYELLGSSEEPEFDLDNAELHGGTHLLVMQAVDSEGGVSAYSEPVVYNQEHPKYIIKRDTLTNIANSVREKSGKTDPIPTENIAAEVRSLVTKTDLPLQSKPCATNNTTVKPDAGYYGLSEVTVAVPDPPLQEPDPVTKNGEVTPAQGYYGLKKVTVAVPDPPLRPAFTVDKNHSTHTATDPETGATYYGLSRVTVHIPEYNGTVDGSGTVSEHYTHKFVSVPDVSVTRIIPLRFITPDDNREYSHLCIYKNGGIRYSLYESGDLTVDPSVYRDAYLVGSGWKSNNAAMIKVLDYGSISYEYRGWLEANSQDDAIFHLRFSYNGNEVELPLNKTITIPCADKVTTTDITLYVKTNLDV